MLKRQAKHFAKKWFRDGSYLKNRDKNDSEILGWWVYITYTGKVVHMEPVDDFFIKMRAEQRPLTIMRGNT